MNRYFKITAIIVGMFLTNCPADTFKHVQSGKVFHGFRTQKRIANRTMIYIYEEEDFKPVDLSEYEVVLDNQGRRNDVVIIEIGAEEILLSQVVSDTLAKAIVNASNKGPRFILLEIDNPGGQGIYMKNLCDAVAGTDNCPVIAFISGGQVGGAYSAAMGVALACDKIYISPNAAIGAIAPPVATSASQENQQTRMDVLVSGNLSSFSAYIGALAEKKNRPVVLARALFDRSVDAVEVSNKQGKKIFVERANRKPSESIVRTLSTPVDQSWQQDDDPALLLISQGALKLTPKDAVYCRMADKIANSQAQLLEDMAASDARLIKAGQIKSVIRKFLSARRKISRLLASVDYLRFRADELKQQLAELQQQQRQQTVTRQFERRQETDNWIIGGETGEPIRRLTKKRQDEFVFETEGITDMDIEDTLDELAAVTADLIRDSRKVIRLASRYPGALLQGTSINSLQQQLNQAIALSDDILRR